MTDSKLIKYIFGVIIASVLFLMSPDIGAQQANSLRYHQYLQDVFQSELVYPQEKNEFQFTLLPQFQESEDFNSFNIPFNAEFGLTDSWQIALSLNSFSRIVPHSEDSFRGVGNFQIGSKYSFMNIANTNFHAAVGFELGIPFRNQNTDSGYGLISYEPFMSLAIDFPRLHQIHLFVMTGLEFFNKKNKVNEELNPTEFNLNGGFLFPYKFIVLITELSCNTNKLSGGDEVELYYTPGIILNLLGAWEAGLGIPIGLNQQSDSFGIMAMFTFEFSISGKDD